MRRNPDQIIASTMKKIMRNPILVLIVSIFVFLSCEKEKQIRKTTCIPTEAYEYLDNSKVGTLCTSDLCLEYFNIWKELIKEKSSLNQAFVDSHIEYCYSELMSFADGVSFRICYKLKVDWAIAYNCDQFIVKINSDNTLYPSLDLPRDTYLSKEEINIAVENRAFHSHITKISSIDNIKYSSMDHALHDLIKYSGVNQLCLNTIWINESNGHLILKASAQYDNEFNSCIEGTIDLITGEKKVDDTPCWID